jgi:hypothetical protein
MSTAHHRAPSTAAQVLGLLIMRPIPLSDDEMNAVYAACSPLAPDRRGGFLQALAAELRDKPIGPGSVHRAIALVQRQY